MVIRRGGEGGCRRVRESGLGRSEGEGRGDGDVGSLAWPIRPGIEFLSIAP